MSFSFCSRGCHWVTVVTVSSINFTQAGDTLPRVRREMDGRRPGSRSSTVHHFTCLRRHSFPLRTRFFFHSLLFFCYLSINQENIASKPFDPTGQSFIKHEFLFIYQSRSLHRLLLSRKGESSWAVHATFELIHQESTAADMKLKVCSMRPATRNTVDFYRFFPVRR